MRGVFPNFSAHARQVIGRAGEAARSLGHSSIGTEHLLVGLVSQQACIAAQVLEEHGLSKEVAWSKVHENTRGPVVEGRPPFSPATKEVLDLSEEEAYRQGYDYVVTGHLLLGVMLEGQDAGAQLLADMGVEMAVVRPQVVEALAAWPGEVMKDFGEPSYNLPLEELPARMPFTVLVPDPPPGKPGIGGVMVTPRGAGFDPAVPVACLTYLVVDDGSHRGNVWIRLSSVPVPPLPLDPDEWRMEGDVSVHEDRSQGYYRCKIRFPSGETHVGIETTAYETLEEVLALRHTLVPYSGA